MEQHQVRDALQSLLAVINRDGGQVASQCSDVEAAKKAQAVVVRYLARIEELLEALYEYGVHKETCPCLRGLLHINTCTCGLTLVKGASVRQH